MSFKSSNLEIMTKSNSIAIIGGGAAGVFAAIAAAEASPSAKIYVFEKSFSHSRLAVKSGSKSADFQFWIQVGVTLFLMVRGAGSQRGGEK